MSKQNTLYTRRESAMMGFRSSLQVAAMKLREARTYEDCLESARTIRSLASEILKSQASQMLEENYPDLAYVKRSDAEMFQLTTISGDTMFLPDMPNLTLVRQVNNWPWLAEAGEEIDVMARTGSREHHPTDELEKQLHRLVDLLEDLNLIRGMLWTAKRNRDSQAKRTE